MTSNVSTMAIALLGLMDLGHVNVSQATSGNIARYTLGLGLMAPASWSCEC